MLISEISSALQFYWTWPSYELEPFWNFKQLIYSASSLRADGESNIVMQNSFFCNVYGLILFLATILRSNRTYLYGVFGLLSKEIKLTK